MKAEQYCVGYIRVSTSSQCDGISLDAQRARITAWAEAMGYQLLAVYEDAGRSGKRADNRPGLKQALKHACDEKAALCVYSLSRLVRSTIDAIKISQRLSAAGADLVSLTERIDTTSATGKMIFRLLSVLSEFERDLISERTSAALKHLKSQSKRVGAIPFGHDLADDGMTLIVNETEQEILKKMRWWRINAKKSFQRIADMLNDRRLPTKTGKNKKWQAKVVRCILRRDAEAVAG